MNAVRDALYHSMALMVAMWFTATGWILVRSSHHPWLRSFRNSLDRFRMRIIGEP